MGEIVCAAPTTTIAARGSDNRERSAKGGPVYLGRAIVLIFPVEGVSRRVSLATGEAGYLRAGLPDIRNQDALVGTISADGRNIAGRG